ncbi:hypothetical protein ACFSPU_11585 [Haoranjiania flava]
MKQLCLIMLMALYFTSCGDNDVPSTDEVVTDTLPPKAKGPVDFVGEYFNPSITETTPEGLRIKLEIRKDSVEGRYLLNFITVMSGGKDSCSLTTKAVTRNDTLFTYITTGIDTAQMYIAMLPQKQRRTLDVFSTRFRDKDVLAKFCIGKASIIGSYEMTDTPSAAFDSTKQQMGFLKGFIGKKASDVQLFKFAVIRNRLETLLGKTEMANLQENWIVEEPFEVKEGNIYNVSACKTRRCNIYKTNIFFDIPNDNITVIISKRGDNTIITEKPSLQLPPSVMHEIERESKEK